MPSPVGCIAELHVVNRRFSRSRIHDERVAEAFLAAALWPLPAPSHFLLLCFLSQNTMVFKRWPREDSQSKIKFICKALLKSRLTKCHLNWFISCFRKVLKPKEVSHWISGLAQGWPWVASHLTFLHICFKYIWRQKFLSYGASQYAQK